MKDIVGYRRVSTGKQQRSGLSLDAQDLNLETFAKMTGGRILRVYTECESGKRNDRPELAKALAHAKRSNAVLAVAVLDRLSRNSYMVNRLLENGTEFVDCQSPHDGPFVTRIKAACSQEELEKLSRRTRDALAAAKARGILLGASRPECRNLTEDARRRGALAAGDAVRIAAREAYSDLVPVLREMQAAGMTQQQIADRLNEDGHTTRGGKAFTQGHISRILRRQK